MAESISDYFKEPRNKKIVNQLLDAGVKPKAQKTSGKKLDGKTFVLTGTLPNYKRSDVEKMIRQAGGKTSSSVSKNTDYVIAGADPGSKLDKANKLGVKTLNEKQFLEML
jgi:DNA ligase (NAD+)